MFETCGKVVLTGKQVNRGGGFWSRGSVEIHFWGDDFSYERLHRKLTERLALSWSTIQRKRAALNININIIDISKKIKRSINIINISKKIKRSIGILSKLRYFLSTKTLLSLYYALVEPFLNYCIIAWGNTYIRQLCNLYLFYSRKP